MLLILSSCSTTPSVSEIPFSQEWKRFLRANVATDNAVKCYLLHGVEIPYNNLNLQRKNVANNQYANHHFRKYINVNSMTQLKLGGKKIAIKAAEKNFISKTECDDIRNKISVSHALQYKQEELKRIKAAADYKNRFKIKCLDIGFKDETESMANCLLKQQEIEAIEKKSSTTVIYKPSRKKSNYQHCVTNYLGGQNCW